LKPIEYLRFLLAFIFIFFTASHLHSQIDSLYDVLGEDSDINEELNELLEQLASNPININSANKEDLQIFPFLGSEQIDIILHNQPYQNKRQLQLLLGTQAYRWFRPYFVVRKPKRKFRGDLVCRTQFTVEKNEGLKEGKYLGSQFAHFCRLRLFYYRNMKAGLLMQKDVGEPDLTDHITGHIQWQDSKSRLKLILGDYQIHAGQGLVFSSPYTLSKSAPVSSLLGKQYQHGRAYQSSNESEGFRGIFSSYKMFAIGIAGFYSQKLQDAVIHQENREVIGIERSGYHRTKTEIEKKSIIKEVAYGTVVDFVAWGHNKIGFALLKSEYNPTIENEKNNRASRLNFFRFAGAHSHNYSAFYNVICSHLLVTGEIAVHKKSALAQQHGFMFSHKPWYLGVKWWHLPRTYHTPFGRMFVSGCSLPSAEEGFYLGLAGMIDNFFAVNTYWLKKKSLWRTYFDPLPTLKSNFFVQAEWSWDQSSAIFLSLQSSHDRFYLSHITSMVAASKNRIRIQVNKSYNDNVRLRSRIEKVYITYSRVFPFKQGINIYQDIFWKFSSNITFAGRFSCFQTSDYDARTYEYEYDLPGNFSTFALYGKGIKWYILFQINVGEKMKIWMKYRHICMDGVSTIGSGLSEIKGDKRQDLKFQLRVSY
jgi:hypothetical protein